MTVIFRENQMNSALGRHVLRTTGFFIDIGENQAASHFGFKNITLISGDNLPQTRRVKKRSKSIAVEYASANVFARGLAAGLRVLHPVGNVREV